MGRAARDRDDQEVARGSRGGRAGDDKGRGDCGEAPRAITHIGCLFSVLVDLAALSFLKISPDSIIYSRAAS
jgi:hypothetical protein